MLLKKCELADCRPSSDAHDNLARGAVFKQIDLCLRKIFEALDDVHFGLYRPAAQQFGNFGLKCGAQGVLPILAEFLRPCP